MDARFLTSPPSTEPVARRLALITLLGVVGLNALGGAWYGLAGARGVPRDWLEGSPFDSYVIPSLVLGIVVGGSQLVACIAVARRWAHARTLALVAAGVLAAWIIVQLAIIGYVSPLQPAMLLAAAATAALAWRRGG